MLRRTVLLGSASLLTASCVSTRGPTVAVGALAPAFSLKSHLGGTVALDDLLSRGPAVVVFYRGFW